MQKTKFYIDIKKLRTDRGWIQSEAAEMLGITRAHLSAVENGNRGISMNVMAAIIQVFNVKYEDFTITTDNKR